MISKKLLEVVCPNTKRYTYKIVSDNVEAIDHEWQGMIGTISTYELINKCKEWLISKEISFTIRYQLLFIDYKDVLQITCFINETHEDGFYDYEESFDGATELEALTLACEYELNKGEENE